MKKNMMKKVFTLSLASLMAVNCALPMINGNAPWTTSLSASAAYSLASGKCGTGLSWVLTDDNVLTISGTGDMNSYAGTTVPWKGYFADIEEVVIEEGVTSIGASAFVGCSNLTEVTIPNSVTKINANAFKGCSNLLNVNLSGAQRTIVDTAFLGTAYESKYYTTGTLSGMNYGAAAKMTGKQVVVNIFLNEITGVLPDLDKESGKKQWEEILGKDKKDFDNYDLENYYYDFYNAHVYRIPKEKLTYTLTSAWTQGFTPTTEEAATAISLDKVNYYEHLGNGSNTLPNDDYTFWEKPVYSDMMKQRLVLVDRALEQLQSDAAEYDVTNLEFVTDTSLNYFFTYNRWDEGLKEFLFMGVEPYRNMIVGNRPQISPTLTGGGLHSSFTDTGSGTANVMEQLKSVSLDRINMFRNNYSQYSDFVMKVKQDHDADGVIILFHLYSPAGKEYTIVNSGSTDEYNKGEEFAMIYHNNVDVIKDQICKLYGANETHDAKLDLSQQNTEIQSGKQTLMMYNETHYGRETSKNGLMAYYLGWCSNIEKDVYNLLASDKNYYLGDIDMDGKFTAEDRKMLSGFIKGKTYLTPMQRMLAGEGLSQDQVIKGWTDRFTIQQYAGNPKYMQLTGANGENLYILCNDLNFDTVLSTEDKNLYQSYVDGTASPTYMQQKFLQYVTSDGYPDKFKDKRDNWHFSNSSSYFSSTYWMSNKHWDVMSKKVGNSESSAFSQIKQEAGSKWLGSCYGMSATSILGYYGLLEPAVYDSKANCVYDLNMTDEIESLINYYQLLQFTQAAVSRSYFNSDKTEKEKLEMVIEALEDGSPTLLSFANSVGHAVVAYGVEYGEYTYDGRTYEGKIITYDCDNADFSDSYCMYFNLENGEWYIPAYSTKYSSYLDTKIKHIIDDVDILNAKGYLDGTPDITINNYIASLYAVALSENHTLSKVGTNGIFDANDDDDGIVRSAYLGDTEDASPITNYLMGDADASYLLKTDKPENLDVFLNYENSFLSAKASNGSAVTFSPEGKIEVEGKDTDFELEIVLDDGYTVTDWFGMTVKGSKTDNAALEKTEDGYLLTCDDLTDITVTGYNHYVSTDVDFTTKYEQVLLHEIDECTIGVSVDTDEDGTFEKLIAKSKPGVEGDLNNDGAFTVVDAVALQRWMLTDDTKLINSKNADFHMDGKLDAFDLAIMKRKLIGE